MLVTCWSRDGAKCSDLKFCKLLLFAQKLVEIDRSQKILEKVGLPTAQELDINWEKKLIGTLAIHVSYRSYKPEVLKYECSKCSRELEEGYVWLM